MRKWWNYGLNQRDTPLHPSPHCPSKWHLDKTQDNPYPILADEWKSLFLQLSSEHADTSKVATTTGLTMSKYPLPCDPDNYVPGSDPGLEFEED